MRRLFAVLGLLVALCLVASPAQAATTTFWVSPLGVYLSPTTAELHGTVTCESGTWTLTFSSIANQPAVNGAAGGTCTGVSQPWTAPIAGGPYFPNQGLAFRATLVTPSGTVTQIPKVILR
jgi:hypothetical protein